MLFLKTYFLAWAAIMSSKITYSRSQGRPVWSVSIVLLSSSRLETSSRKHYFVFSVRLDLQTVYSFRLQSSSAPVQVHMALPRMFQSTFSSVKGPAFCRQHTEISWLVRGAVMCALHVNWEMYPEIRWQISSGKESPTYWSIQSSLPHACRISSHAVKRVTCRRLRVHPRRWRLFR